MSLSSLDHGLCVELSSYVEQLTTSGQSSLDNEVLKKIKNICRRSDEYVKHTYYLVMSQLKEDHAEIRLSAFQIIAELFKRSHHFRELLVSEFQDFLELTVETNPEYPLPPPKEVAKNLKTSTLKAVQYWYDNFADGYKKLVLGYNFLKNCKKVDFHQMRMQSEAERRREEEQERKKQIARQTRLNKVDKEMKEMAVEVMDCLNQLDSCFKLLLPDVNEFEVHGRSEDFSITPTTTNNTIKLSKDKGADVSSGFSQGAISEQSRENAQQKSSTQNGDGPSCETDNEPSTSSIDANQESSNGENATNEQSNGVDTNCKTSQQSSDFDNSLQNGNGQSCETNNEPSESSDDIGANHESNDGENEDEETEEFLRAHGLGSRTYNLSITVDADEFAIRENDDNTDILRNLQDQHRLVAGRFLPAVARWIEALTKNSGSSDKLKQCIDIKGSLDAAKRKYKELDIKWRARRRESQMDSDDDDDEEDDGFEDVPQKDGYEADVPEFLKLDTTAVLQQPSTSNAKKSDSDVMDPTTFATSMTKLRKIFNSKDKASSEIGDTSAPGPSTSTAAIDSSNENRAEMLRRAPVVEFGVDLMDWGEKKEAPSVIKYESLHRFWQPSESKDTLSKGALEMLQARAIEFSGKFEPVKWKCRALLPNGTLCPRMDRVKCPFHGKIISRDDHGNPTTEKDRRELQRRQTSQVEDWQDPEFLRDIQAETGRDLTVDKKGKGKGKGKQRKQSNLTDLRAKTNTTRNRLEKKVFNRQSLKRVASAMDRIDDKIRKDKFSHSFLSTFPNKIG